MDRGRRNLRDLSEFGEIQAFVIDMDGVLWRGERLLPGVPEFIKLLRERALPFVLATNNATQTPERVQGKLDVFGIAIRPEEVITTAEGSAQFLLRQQPAGSRVYAIGTEGLRAALKDAGFEVVDRADEVAAVVVGMDWELRWDQLEEAAYALNRGAYFLGTNPDRSFPTERGLAPGNGATLAALEAATGCEPAIYGKPEPHLFLDALDRMGVEPEQALAIGDRLETDILGGLQAGMQTALVMTGVTDAALLERSRVQPDWVFEDLTELVAALG